MFVSVFVVTVNNSDEDSVRTARKGRQAQNDEGNVLGDYERSCRHTVRSVRQAQFDGVRVDQYVPRVAHVAR